MKILHSLIQLTTTATLAASFVTAGGAAFAARIAIDSTGSSIDYSTDNSIPSRVARQTSTNSRLKNSPQKYEPTENGNPATSDGTGTR